MLSLLTIALWVAYCTICLQALPYESTTEMILVGSGAGLLCLLTLYSAAMTKTTNELMGLGGVLFGGLLALYTPLEVGSYLSVTMGGSALMTAILGLIIGVIFRKKLSQFIEAKRDSLESV